MNGWTKGEVIALFGVIVTGFGVAVPVMNPELRCFLVKDCQAIKGNPPPPVTSPETPKKQTLDTDFERRKEATLNTWNEMQNIDKDSVKRDSDIDSQYRLMMEKINFQASQELKILKNKLLQAEKQGKKLNQAEIKIFDASVGSSFGSPVLMVISNPYLSEGASA